MPYKHTYELAYFPPLSLQKSTEKYTVKGDSLASLKRNSGSSKT